MATGVSVIKIQGGGLKQIADRYPKLDATILEYIQNAIDARASEIYVKIDFPKREVSIRDDGKGLTVQEFERALKLVCESTKTEDDLGQYGIGLVSGIGKCAYFTFITIPKAAESSVYHEWTFDSETITENIDAGVPYRDRKDLVFSRSRNLKTIKKGQQVVNWRTEVRLHRFIRDRVLTRLSSMDLKNAILERYSEAMKRTGATIYLTFIGEDKKREPTMEIKPLEFLGKPLPIVTKPGKICGKTTFELFTANKKAKGRHGKVLLGIQRDLYKIGFATFAKEVGLFDQETIEVLSSGALEGHIISEKCELHPSRRRFVENDALVEFCAHVEEWVRSTGLAHVAELVSEKKFKRYQMLGMQSMRFIENILRDKQFDHLMDVVHMAKIGTIGIGHTKMPATEEKLEGDTSLSTQGGKVTEGPTPTPNMVRPPKEPETAHPGHTPFVVTGPAGQRRTKVKGHSTGLIYEYVEMSGVESLWKYDRRTATLSFNIRHPLWEEAEKNDRLLVAFQDTIAYKALNIETIPEGEWREAALLAANQEMGIALRHLAAILPKRGRSPFQKVA